MTAYVGQTVHYVAHGTPIRPDGTQAYTATCRAAIITELGEGHRHGLCVLNPTGQFFNPGVRGHGGVIPPEIDGALCPQTGRAHPPGTWHTPEPADTDGPNFIGLHQ